MRVQGMFLCRRPPLPPSPSSPLAIGGYSSGEHKHLQNCASEAALSALLLLQVPPAGAARQSVRRCDQNQVVKHRSCHASAAAASAFGSASIECTQSREMSLRLLANPPGWPSLLVAPAVAAAAAL